MARNELAFQTRIVDSYAKCGGFARKWASDMQAGQPDIIACLPEFGVHLTEVKHEPEFGVAMRSIANPMTKLQRLVCQSYEVAGGLVFLSVIGESERAIGSFLYVFPTSVERLVPSGAIWATPYVPGRGYDMNVAVRRAHKVLKGAKA